MPRKEQEPRSEQYGLRITPTLKKILAKAAEDEGRSISDYMIRAVTEHLKREGYLKK